MSASRPRHVPLRFWQTHISGGPDHTASARATLPVKEPEAEVASAGEHHITEDEEAELLAAEDHIPEDEAEAEAVASPEREHAPSARAAASEEEETEVAKSPPREQDASAEKEPEGELKSPEPDFASHGSTWSAAEGSRVLPSRK